MIKKKACGREENSGNGRTAGCENHGNGKTAGCENYGNETTEGCENSGNEMTEACGNSGEQGCGNGLEKEEQEKEDEEKERRKRKRRTANAILTIIIIILILLCFRSCRARDEPLPDDTERVYEEDCRPQREDVAAGADGRRLNIAVAQEYRISDEKPYFYIGFPEDNAYDVVFTMLGAGGEELYRTDYVAPGTSVAVDGTAFLEKGERKVDCLVSVYDRDSGALVSDCTTVVLNVSYR